MASKEPRDASLGQRLILPCTEKIKFQLILYQASVCLHSRVKVHATAGQSF